MSVFLKKLKNSIRKRVPFLSSGDAKKATRKDINQLNAVCLSLKEEIGQLRQSMDLIQREMLVENASSFLSLPQPFTAWDLYQVFSLISTRWQRWSTCDVIIVCPLLRSGAARLFPDKQIICIDEPAKLWDALDERQFDVIGVLSPWLMRQFFYDAQSPYTLLSHCRVGLVYVAGYCGGESEVNMRKQLHRVGFHEIAQVDTLDGSVDQVSIGYGIDGLFQLFGNQPGLSFCADHWNTYQAMRLPVSNLESFTWKNVLPHPLMHMGYGYHTGGDGVSLAYTQLTSPVDDLNIGISANMCWSSGGHGDASLIASYHGHGDALMYVCMLQVQHPEQAKVSLWIHDGDWRLLHRCNVPQSWVMVNQGKSTLPLWFKLTRSNLSAGSAKHVLFDMTNTDLKRVPTLGIRVAGNAVAVVDVACSRDENAYA